MIAQHSLDKIFDAADIVDVIGEFVELEKKGTNWLGLSPFTNENTPSFSVSPSKQIFKCFSSGEGGNVTSFLMKHKHMTFPEAIQFLAEKYHLEVEYEGNFQGLSPEEKKQQKEERSTAAAIVAWAAKEYYKYFNQLPTAHKAHKEVFEHRQLTQAEVVQWQIGYAPEFSKLLREQLIERGKVTEGKKLFLIGDKVDKMLDRIIYPIHDANGEIIGLAGRDLSGNKKAAKFINPTDTLLYNKDRVLYGLGFAKEAINKLGYANWVEGYNDVIAMHRYGMENTVASCGTAITENQVKILKRYTSSVRLILDNDAHKPDNPGLKAMLKYIPLFVKHGFEVNVVLLPEGEDPDSLSRQWPATFRKYRTYVFDEVTEDGISFLAQHKYSKAKSITEKSLVKKEVAEVLATIGDEVVREAYIEECAKLLSTTKADVNRLVVELRKKLDVPKTKAEKFKHYSDAKKEDFNLPRQIEKSGYGWDDVKENIIKYGLIVLNNKIWAQRGDKPVHNFEIISNFSVEIIQHINSDSDDKSMRLVRCVNEHEVEMTFDTLSTDFVELRSFKRMVEGKGNYRFTGTPVDYERVKHKLYEEMGDGRLIEQLGWQPEGFWACNNVVIIDGKTVPLNDNGCFTFKKRQYYIKSANKVYENMPEKFGNQKRAVILDPKVDFTTYLEKVRRVHREHSFNMILFTIGTVFSDIIYERVDFYPIVFLYGEASTGKDQLIKSCQSIFGKAQSPIKITGKANTDKGKIRKFAEFINMIVHLSEYKEVNEYVDEEIKSIWDRDGYTRSDRESKYLTEEVPILSTCVFTGNYYPTKDALITRIVAEEFTKSDFSAEDKTEFNTLSEWIDEGVSGYLVEILELRAEMITQFRVKHRDAYKDLRANLQNISLPDRMLSNLAVFGAVYQIAQHKITFPFSYEEWVNHSVNSLQKQLNKRSSGSVVAKFWECFIECIKDRANPIKEHHEFKIAGATLSIQYTQVYAKYTKMHFTINREKGENKSTLLDKLQKSEAYKGSNSSKRFGPTKKSSAIEFNLDQLAIKDDLLDALQYVAGSRKATTNGDSAL